MMALTAAQEFLRVAQMVSDLTVSVPIALISKERISEIEQRAPSDPTIGALNAELRKKLKAIARPEDYTQMAQAYEAYAEASFCLVMADRGVQLERTPGTGKLNQKRPDFVHHHGNGDIYFEVKALEIAAPIARHKEIAHQALEIAADLDQRARAGSSFRQSVGNLRAASGNASRRTPMRYGR
ncbi:hypothetical protein ACFPLB_08005 [Aquamicrobium segne]|uniref:Uncharacterized protein n=1 Tax=Aquamicrobium segne TaxID=469547 RepID=A0ABW0GYE5_9HYPH|nr:hypothetical protein [Paracoccus sp. (in: a-proteobacteria)]